MLEQKGISFFQRCLISTNQIDCLSSLIFTPPIYPKTSPVPALTLSVTACLENSKMARFRNLPLRLLRGSWRRLPEYPAILCLDGRTLQRIYQYLSLVDQVCLSLSCKELLGMFGTILKHEDLEFPRLLLIRNPILCVNSQDVLRNQLLLRLENRRWAYCGVCLKLHPRKEFPRHLSRESAIERSCANHAGIVDLCPCISLTIRDRDQLVKILKSPEKPVKIKYGPFEHGYFSGNNSSLTHYCTEKYAISSRYDVEVILVLSITDTGQLCVWARHTVKLPITKHWIGRGPSLACPHLDLSDFVFRENGTKVSQRYPETVLSKSHQDLLSRVPGKKALRACSTCQTVITEDQLSEDPDQARFWVIRNLGSCKWPPSRSWFDQCRFTGVNFWKSHSYWSVYQMISSERRKTIANILNQVPVAELFKYDKGGSY